jgi:DNA replicative helicase MCM subunit Mcm2 (Cdc46/Mcm family)
MARIRFSEEVAQPDVEEAMHLMHMCHSHLRHSKEQDQARGNIDPISDIFHIIKEMAQSNPEKKVQ